MSKREEIRTAILAGVVHALVPLARICLRHSLKIQNFLEAVKLAFVRAAELELKAEGDKVSVSRLSVMSGVSRRDVTRLQKEGLEVERSQDLTTKVLGNWQTLPEFTAKGKKARVLTCEGSESEFVQLVRTVSADVAPYTVLYELERLGLVEKERGTVRMVSRIYVADPGDFEQGFSMLGEDVADLTLAIEENLIAEHLPSKEERVPHLHLKTEYSNIAPKHLEEVRDWVLTEGSSFHRKVRNFLSSFDLDVNPKLREGKEKGVRVAYVSFSVSEDKAKGGGEGGEE